MGPDEMFQRAVIARRYYLEGRTRVEIAEEFGLSRFKVARMLEEALESGMVEITIHDPGSIDVDLSAALQKRYGLQHAYAVVAQSKNTADRVEAVAKAMADLLQSILREGDVIGIDCGRTMTRIAPYLQSLPTCDVVQLTGLAGGLTSNGADLTRRISEVTGGRSWPLYAPYVVADARTAESLASTPPIKDAFANQSRVTCALVSVGGWTPEASQVYTSISEEEAAALYETGVRAETCGLLLDANGTRVAGLDERRMGITEEGLRAIPTVIAICAGAEKITATRAVLRSGLVSALVTDTEIAAAVLD
ncbi:DNA-binding transcriptional regulator [Mycolicibacterium rufum]|uniref:DNA-binding transcriptional regulator n=1 Tax=Mycolicibacterium rufum TaxID=318424 RepID=A0A9X2YDY9_9MYCO|nr:sugar-binding domain-containing protein [Mycolicibacterium rufum]KGI71236.1 DeoR faimly transcriptional regulator [Mycolicibacterium rufum]MCV7070896.1 DNA-binding transcriptional regulator [Mycolicibacterium rufum]ULP36712.1 DNA-binding transcriptional regulator [Mycolicibacterium rufum]